MQSQAVSRDGDGDRRHRRGGMGGVMERRWWYLEVTGQAIIRAPTPLSPTWLSHEPKAKRPGSLEIGRQQMRKKVRVLSVAGSRLRKTCRVGVGGLQKVHG